MEPVPAVVNFVQRGRVEVKMVQVVHELLHLRVLGIVQQEPVQRVVEFPFDILAELGAHEHQFFTGMRVLIGIQ
ncbi:hypothetical protein SDC9_188237 [bioreactor metagenome]|uniref:Uncharacterized protein n=1 Tax=bioreactor metagenome TaxID=1076179 RepID=A0A645HNV7_9ZZZZ